MGKRVEEIQLELKSCLSEKVKEIEQLQESHAVEIEEVKNDLSTTKIELQKVMGEKIQLQNNIYVVVEGREKVEKEYCELKKEYQKEISLREIIENESAKAKSEISFYIQEVQKLKNEAEIELQLKLKPLEDTE